MILKILFYCLLFYLKLLSKGFTLYLNHLPKDFLLCRVNIYKIAPLFVRLQTGTISRYGTKIYGSHKEDNQYGNRTRYTLHDSQLPSHCVKSSQDNLSWLIMIANISYNSI